MKTIEVRHLRYFAAVADELSILAAARILHITQPALSRQIQDLEEAVGVALFERHAKGVQLTDAGVSLLKDAKDILARLEQARDRAHRIAQGLSGELKLGVLPTYLSMPRTLGILNHFRQHNPEVLLTIEPMLSSQQMRAIRAGEIDAGIMAWREAEDSSLSGIVLQRERFVLAMPQERAVQTQLPTHLADIAAEPFVWFSRDRSSAQHSLLIAECSKAGFVPKITQIGTDMPTVLGLVAAGMGFALVPASLQNLGPPSVTFIKLKDLSATFDIEFVYSLSRRSPTLSRIIESVCTVMSSEAP